MKIHKPAVLAVCVLAIGGTLFVAAPAQAVTAVSLTIVGGALSMTVPPTAALGSWTDTVAGGSISTPLGEVEVDDARGAAAGSGWVVSVISTALTPSAGPTIPASALGYTVGSITKVGTATYTANNPPALTGAVAAVTATAITGNNSAIWNPTISIAIPGGMAAGTYTGLITHSVS